MKSNRKYHCPSHIVKIKLFGGTYCLLHLYINVHTYSKSHKKGWKTQRYSSSRNLPNLWSWPWKESRYKSPSHRWPQPSPEEELPFIIMVTLLWDCSSNCHSLSVCYLPGSVLNSLHSSAPLTFTVTPGSGCYYTPLYGWENQGSERWRIDQPVYSGESPLSSLPVPLSQSLTHSVLACPPQFIHVASGPFLGWMLQGAFCSPSFMSPHFIGVSYWGGE